MTAPDHWQDVRLVQLDIKGSGMRYHKFMYLTYCYLHNFPHQWPKWEGGGLGTTIYQTQMKKNISYMGFKVPCEILKLHNTGIETNHLIMVEMGKL